MFWSTTFGRDEIEILETKVSQPQNKVRSRRSRIFKEKLHKMEKKEERRLQKEERRLQKEERRLQKEEKARERQKLRLARESREVGENKGRVHHGEEHLGVVEGLWGLWTEVSCLIMKYWYEGILYRYSA